MSLGKSGVTLKSFENNIGRVIGLGTAEFVKLLLGIYKL